MTERDLLIDNILKAELILSDYTLVADEIEKETCIELLSEYIDRLDYQKATFIFNQICQTADDLSRDIYVGILSDILTDIKAENEITATAWTTRLDDDTAIAM